MDRKTETGADKHGFSGDMYMEEMVKIRWIFIQTHRVAADSTELKYQAVVNMDCSSKHAAMVDDGLIPANFSRKKWSTARLQKGRL